MLMKDFIANQARDAKAASRILAGASTEMKNAALSAMAVALEKRQDEIRQIDVKFVTYRGNVGRT